MIQSIQKVIKVGDSGAVTIPAKQMKQQKIKFGDQVEIIIRPVSTSARDKEVMDAAKDILKRYKSDFENLAGR